MAGPYGQAAPTTGWTSYPNRRACLNGGISPCYADNRQLILFCSSITVPKLRYIPNIRIAGMVGLVLAILALPEGPVR